MLRVLISPDECSDKHHSCTLLPLHREELLKQSTENAVMILEGAINLAFHKGLIEGLRMNNKKVDGDE